MGRKWLVRQRAESAPIPARDSSLVVGRVPDPAAAASELARIIASSGHDRYGHGLLDRRAMMEIPAVRRGRNLIAGTIAALPLRAWRKTPDGPVDVALPRLLEQPEDWRARVNTLMWLVDDLIFHPYGWWEIVAKDAAGWPVKINRVEPWRVSWSWTDGTGRPINPVAYLDGTAVKEGRLIRFDGPDEGLVELGSPALSIARLLERAACFYADVDVPTMILKYEGQGLLNKEDALAIRESWDKARRESSTAVISANMGAIFPQVNPLNLQLLEARRYAALETARLLNLDPYYLSANESGSALTYTNLTMVRRDLVELSLQPYIAAIEQRLSLDDLTPHGTRVRFDLDGFYASTPLERAQYLKTLVDAGIVQPDQAAALAGLDTASTIDDMPGADR